MLTHTHSSSSIIIKLREFFVCYVVLYTDIHADDRAVHEKASDTTLHPYSHDAIFSLNETPIFDNNKIVNY